MRRRALLSAVTAGTVGLAGCSIRWGADDGPPASETRDPTNASDATTTGGTPAEDGPTERPPVTDVVDLGAGPRTLAVRPSDHRVAERAHLSFGFYERDGEGPALLSVTVGNLRDHEIVLKTRRLPTIRRSVVRPVRSDDARLVFVPRGDNDVAERRPSIERDPEGYWRLAEAYVPGRFYPTRVRLDPGQRVRVDCAVVGPPGTAGRPPGVYETEGDDDAVSVTVWHSERPGPTAPSRFGDRAVPSPFPDSDRAVTWYHEAGPETPVYVVPSAERATLPTRVRFRAVNHTAETLGCGRWRLYKLVDGTAYDLTPGDRSDVCRRLRPGEHERHDLRAFGGRPVPDDDAEGRTAGLLGGGTYAVVVGYGAATPASGALVDLEGPPVEVRPTDGAQARRDGDTVIVSVPLPRGDPEPASATLTRAETADRELIAEQVTRPWNRPLRNTVPFLGGDVDRVVLQTAVRAVEGILPGENDIYRFSFGGQAYRLEAEQLP